MLKGYGMLIDDRQHGQWELGEGSNVRENLEESPPDWHPGRKQHW